MIFASCQADERNDPKVLQKFAEELTQKAKKEKSGFVINCEVDGKIVIASPYSIGAHKDELVKEVGMNAFSDFKKAGGETRFCCALFQENKLVDFLFLDPSPIAFNGIKTISLKKGKKLKVDLKDFKISSALLEK